MRALFALLVVLTLPIAGVAGTIDTLRLDDGTASGSNQIRASWEESVILSPKAPCIVKKVMIYYAAAGKDTVRITGDAAEGTIPPTQYCFAYNTLARVVVNVAAPGWKEIDLSTYDIRLGGYDRVVVQHILASGVATWAQDAGQSSVTSYLYDAVTPNPNFYNIPGIYYRANGDYLVRLVVEYPATEQPAPTWADVTNEMGIVNASGDRFRSDLATIADINGDHWDDVIIGSVAYINKQGASFERKGLGISASNTVWADVDNDGDLDCFAVFATGAAGRHDGIYENDGQGNLTDRSDGAGLDEETPTVTPLFLDYDHDGDLDLFIAKGRQTVNNNEVYYQDRLYRNDGDFTFTDVTAPSKIALGEAAPYYDCWGASLVDVNMDGWTDIFVATYRLAPDRLYINNHDGTFTEASQQTGCIGMPTAQPGYYGHGMGSDWGDFDNDGDLDLFVGNLGHPDQRGQYSNPSIAFRNNGTPSNPQYEPWIALDPGGKLHFSGIAFREMNAGMCLFDVDHDGLLDLYHGQISYDLFGEGATRPAHFYVQGADRFEDRSWESGLFIHGSWTGDRFDFDRDGDMDLLAASGRHEVRLYRNDFEKHGNSITIGLNNVTDNTMPRDAYGATVRVYAGGKRFVRQLPGTVIGGRCSQMSDDLHFGIGKATMIDSIGVDWPNGKHTRYTDVVTNHYVILNADGTSSAPLITAPQLVYPPQHGIDIATRPAFVINGIGGPFELQVAEDAAFTRIVGIAGRASNPVTIDSTLTPGRTYFWRARYERGPAVGAWSSAWQFTVGKPAPEPPTILGPSSDQDVVPLTAMVWWTPAQFTSWKSAPVTYELELLTPASATVMCTKADIPDTISSCMKLEPAQTVLARVRGVAVYGGEKVAGPWSNEVLFTTYDRVPAISLTTPEDGATDQPVRPRLNWLPHAWADQGYEVQYGLDETFTDFTSRTRPDTSLFIISALETGRTYFWRVRGLNEVGEGEWSETHSFTVTGTVAVEEFESESCYPNDVIVVYDVLGHVICRTLGSEWYAVEPSLPNGPLFYIRYSENGDVKSRGAMLMR